jgi:hypothetical protein
MKIKLFTVALAFISVNALAQITVTDADLVNVGDVIYTVYDNNPSSLIAIGNSGTGQFWDFSSLQTLSVDTQSYISPIGTQYEASYPNANLALNTNGNISYFNVSSAGVYAHGINDTVFNAPALFLPLSLTYGLSTTDGPIIVLEEEITGPLLAIALPAVTVAALTNNIANRADTALIQVTNTSEFSVSASGTITTPLGTYDVLRLKEEKEISSVLNIYCSDTLTQMGMWFNNIPFSSIPMLGFSNEENEVTYRWITNDATVSYLVAAVDVDSFDIVKEASYQTISIVNSVSSLSLSDINIYPIPTTYNLTVEAENNELIILDLLDVNGKLILSTQFTNSTNLDLSKISKGIYYLSLNTAEGKLTKKIVKQ